MKNNQRNRKDVKEDDSKSKIKIKRRRKERERKIQRRGCFREPQRNGTRATTKSRSTARSGEGAEEEEEVSR